MMAATPEIPVDQRWFIGIFVCAAANMMMLFSQDYPGAAEPQSNTKLTQRAQSDADKGTADEYR